MTKPIFSILDNDRKGISGTTYMSAIDATGKKRLIGSLSALQPGESAITISVDQFTSDSNTPAQEVAANEVVIEILETAIKARQGSIPRKSSSGVQPGMFVRAMNVANIEDVFYGFLDSKDEHTICLSTYPDIPNTRVTEEELPASAYRLSRVHLPLEGTDGVIAHELEERLSSTTEEEWTEAVPNFSQQLLGHLARTAHVSGYDRVFVATLQHLTDQELLVKCLLERHEALFENDCNFGIMVDRITDKALRQKLLLELPRVPSVVGISVDLLASHDQRSLAQLIRSERMNGVCIRLVAYVALSFLTDEASLIEFGKKTQEGLPWAFAKASVRRIYNTEALHEVELQMKRLRKQCKRDSINQPKEIDEVLSLITTRKAQLTTP